MTRGAISAAALLVFLLGSVRIASALTVQDVVNQVSQTSYQNYLTALPTHRYDNRSINGGAQHDVARDTIYNGLRQVGLDAYLDPFSYKDDNGTVYNGNNVIAVKQGTTRPNEIYVVGSHYDSTVRSGQNTAYQPGADDNGSGVAAVLELARVMSNYNFGATIVFAAFDGEEIDATVKGKVIERLGSTHYVGEHKYDTIKGMLSVDMIAWNAPGSFHNKADIESRGTMTTIRSQLSSAINTYGGGLVVDVRGNPGDWSDHVAFADAGFQAAMLIEDDWWDNPNYHRNGDYVENPGYLDYVYATKMTKSAMGYFATQAGVVGYVPEPGSLMALGSGLSCLLVLARRRRSA